MDLILFPGELRRGLHPTQSNTPLREVKMIFLICIRFGTCKMRRLNRALLLLTLENFTITIHNVN